MTPGMLQLATDVIRKAGLNPNDFCMIRNQCFLSEQQQQQQGEMINKKSSANANKFSYSSAAVAATGIYSDINNAKADLYQGLLCELMMLM